MLIPARRPNNLSFDRVFKGRLPRAPRVKLGRAQNKSHTPGTKYALD
jgi:hypothetical protein